MSECVATYQAPEQKPFPVVDQGIYTAFVASISVEDYTATPDKFGHKGHYTFVFRWELEDVVEEQGEPITLVQYVRFTTGNKPATQGGRIGRLPWLTEITRAFGEADLLPGQNVDPQQWVHKRARLGVLLNTLPDGTFKNSINTVGPIIASRSAVLQQPMRSPTAAPLADDEVLDDQGNWIPF